MVWPAEKVGDSKISVFPRNPLKPKWWLELLQITHIALHFRA